MGIRTIQFLALARSERLKLIAHRVVDRLIDLHLSAENMADYPVGLQLLKDRDQLCQHFIHDGDRHAFQLAGMA